MFLIVQPPLFHPHLPQSHLFSLLYPALHGFPGICDLFIDVAYAELRMDLGEAHTLEQTITDLEMRLRHSREALLILPRKIRDIAHGDGEDGPAGSYAESERRRRTQQDVAVACDDTAGHGGDQDVDGARHELLTRLAGWGERRNRRCEGLLEVKGAVHGLVDLVLGGHGAAVQQHADLADLDGQAVCRRRASVLLDLFDSVNDLVRGLFDGAARGGSWGECGDGRIGLELVVDGLPLLFWCCVSNWMARGWMSLW